MTNTAIKVSHLTKIYKLYDKPIDRLKESLHPLKKQYHKDFYALNDVSFEIKKGETVGIIGKNGAGKSTLLKIITGVLTPSSGHVHVNGRIASLLELGAGFNPEYTGIENIYLQGTLMGYSHQEMETKIDEILAFADIGDFVHQPVKSYSSGMYARLAFSVAINVEPDILIVDEALSVGDMFFVEKCITKMNQIITKNKSTLIFVSHDLTTIRRSVGRVIWFENGSIKEDGNALKVLDSYAYNSCNSKEKVVNDLSIIQSEYQWQAYKSRFGTGKIKIEKIILNNALTDFHTETILHTGEDLKIQIHFHSSVNDESIPITLSIAFFDDKGLHCFGISPKFHGLLFDSNDSYAECTLKNFSLLRGRYALSVGIWDESILIPYDLQERIYDVVMISDNFPEDGKFLPNYEWSKK